MVVEEETAMLRKMTIGFLAAVRLIAAENVNAGRSFLRDVGGLFSRLSQVQKNSRLRGGKKLS